MARSSASGFTSATPGSRRPGVPSGSSCSIRGQPRDRTRSLRPKRGWRGGAAEPEGTRRRARGALVVLTVARAGTPAGAGGGLHATANTGSGGAHDDVLYLRHVTVGGGGRLIRAASASAGVHVRRVPVPPVVLRGGFLEAVVPLRRLVQQICEGGD